MGLGAALALLIVIGFVGAATNAEEPIRAGTGAGFLAAVVGMIGMIGPAIAVEAASDIVIASGGGTVTVSPAVLAGAVVDVSWLPATIGAVVLATGLALGAVGGVIFDLWRGVPSRTGRDIHYSPVPVVGLMASLVWGSAVAWMLRYVDNELLPGLQITPNFFQRLAMSAPLGLLGIMVAMLVAWGFRDSGVIFRSGARVLAVAWGGIVAAMPVFLMLLVVVLYPRAYTSPVTWSAVVLVIVTAAIALWTSFRSEDRLAEHPRLLPQVIADGVLVSLATLGQGVMAIGASVLAGWLLVLPHLLELFNGKPRIAVNPEALVQRVYASGWGVLAAHIVVAAMWLMLAVPAWMAISALANRRS